MPEEDPVAQTLTAPWDKNTAAYLRRLAFTQEQIGIVLGLLAEHRQQADYVGYARGYNAAHPTV